MNLAACRSGEASIADVAEICARMRVQLILHTRLVMMILTWADSARLLNQGENYESPTFHKTECSRCGSWVCGGGIIQSHAY